MSSGQIGESKINEVRERIDIVELVSQYVTLKRSGGNHAGLCPFHSEKSPSFSVHAGRQFYHCFGCGVGGDIFSFLMKIEGLAFPDAVRRLAERAGVELEEQQLSPEEEQRHAQRERFYRINEVAADYFHQTLMDGPTGEVCRQYLKRRGYGRKAAAEYQIGYAADSWEGLSKHLQQQGLVADDVRELGLIRPRKEERGDYDLFRGRLMFPIYDLSGRVVAFGGRVLDDSKPKYINSPESPIYHKGQVLYGLYQARQAMRQSGEVILVEGYFDQLALYRAGVPQVVATCGTALTSDHARLLKRYVQRVLLLFDQDAAGKKATFKAMAALQEEGLPALVIDLPSGEDPDSFVQQHGPAAFKARLQQARPAMDLFMEDALGQAGTAVEQKVRAVEGVIDRIAGLTSGMEQDLYLKELAVRSGIDLLLLQQKRDESLQRQEAALNKPAPGRTAYRPAASGAAQPYAVPPPSQEYLPPSERIVEGAAPLKVEDSWSRSEGVLLSLLLHRADARERIAVAQLPEYFCHPVALKVAEQLLRVMVDDGGGAAAVIDKLDATLCLSVEPLIRQDPERFAGDIDDLLLSCQASLRREQKKIQVQEALRQISQAEQAGNLGPEDLVHRFKKLK